LKVKPKQLAPNWKNVSKMSLKDCKIFRKSTLEEEKSMSIRLSSSKASFTKRRVAIEVVDFSNQFFSRQPFNECLQLLKRRPTRNLKSSSNFFAVMSQAHESLELSLGLKELSIEE
jgi:hypothetical protein